MGNRHNYMQNLEGDPKLITSMTGGNYAVNGDANVSFNVANGGNQGISANQHQLQYLAEKNETSGNPSLITSMTGGNYAVNGNGNVSFNIANKGNQGVSANQGAAPTP